MGMTGMIKHIWRAEGLAGFFKGFGSSLACHVTYSFLWYVSCRCGEFQCVLINLFLTLLNYQPSPMSVYVSPTE